MKILLATFTIASKYSIPSLTWKHSMETFNSNFNCCEFILNKELK